MGATHGQPDSGVANAPVCHDVDDRKRHMIGPAARPTVHAALGVGPGVRGDPPGVHDAVVEPETLHRPGLAPDRPSLAWQAAKVKRTTLNRSGFDTRRTLWMTVICWSPAGRPDPGDVTDAGHPRT
jgi:hypothetical protein